MSQTLYHDHTRARGQRESPTERERIRAADDALDTIHDAFRPRGDAVAVGFIDVVRFILRERLTRRQLRQLKGTGAKQVRQKDTPQKIWRSRWFYSLQLNLPRRATLDLFAAFKVEHAISYLEVAIDRESDYRHDRADMRDALLRHAVVRFKSTQRIWRHYSTRYWSRRSAARNLVCYVASSKLTDRTALHGEIRINGKCAAERLGKRGPEDTGLCTVADLVPDKFRAAYRDVVQLYNVTDPAAVTRAVDHLIETEMRERVTKLRKRLRLFTVNRAVERLEDRVRNKVRIKWAGQLFNHDREHAARIVDRLTWGEAPVTNLLTFARAAVSPYLTKLDNAVLVRDVQWLRLRKPDAARPYSLSNKHPISPRNPIRTAKSSTPAKRYKASPPDHRPHAPAHGLRQPVTRWSDDLKPDHHLLFPMPA